MALSDVTTTSLRSLQDASRDRLQAATTLDAAAQLAASMLYETFLESLVLTRIYVTVPFGRLPQTNRSFVQQLANANAAERALLDTTPVLSLMGTRGTEPAWNDRRQSKGHVGIPLITTSFVDAIPMIARLLQEMGVGIHWIDAQDPSRVDQLMDGGLCGLFYVRDARTERDASGRLIIPAQEFVAKHQVRTVFGMGGSYMGGLFATYILFCREELPKAIAQRYVPLVNVFKAATTRLALRGLFFGEE
jgi:hypothetical protein